MHYLDKFFLAAFGMMLALPAMADAEQPDISDKTDQSGNYFILGLGVGYAPEYVGGDTYEYIAQPSINAKYDDFFLNTRGFGMEYSGLGYNIIDDNDVKLGPIFNIDLGRDEDQSSDLQGLGDIDPTLLGGAFVEYEPGNWRFTAAALVALVGDAEGFGVNVGAGYDFKISKKLVINPFIGSTWVSEKYSETYFGIDSVQSARSGLPQYSASSGFNNFTIGLNTRYFFDQHWAILGIATYNKLSGSAADSPLTRQRGSDTFGYGSVSILYKF